MLQVVGVKKKIIAHQDIGMLVLSLPMKSGKRLVRDVIYTGATYAEYARDVPDCQNGSAHGRIFVSFACRFCNKLEHKSTKKLLWLLSFLLSFSPPSSSFFKYFF